MTIRVFATSDRKCFASFDYVHKSKRWVMSFGDRENPENINNIEVEFTQKQLVQLKELVAGLPNNPPTRQYHSGRC